MSKQLTRELKKIIWIAAVVAIIVSTKCRAENYQSGESPLSFISHLGPALFNRAGGVFLPLHVLQGVSEGRVSPMMQFILMNHIMTSMVSRMASRPPKRRDGYKKAKDVFDYGVCRIKKGFQSAMLVGMLSGLSSNQRTGGSSDANARQSNRLQAQAFSGAFQREDNCGGDSSEGFDPSLLLLFQSSN